MEMKLEMVPVNKVVDAHSGVSMFDTTQTIMSELTQIELDRYGKAINKVEKRQALNLKDLKVLEKIDVLTYAKHGMCLKDSRVTKARLKACKKYGFEFIDRDGLIDHMNQMSGFQKQEVLLPEELENGLLSHIFIGFGKDRFEDFINAIMRIMDGIDLNVPDVIVLVDVDSFVRQKFGLSILDHQLQSAIDKACDRYDVAISVISKDTIH